MGVPLKSLQKMEWDCRLNDSVVGRRRPRFSRALIILVILIINKLSTVVSLYLDCSEVSKAKFCLCSKLDEYYTIECPAQILTVYPFQLKVYNSDPVEAVIYVECEYGTSEFKSDLVGGVDLSTEKIGATITKLSINKCPPNLDGIRDLLKRVNIPTEQIKKFTFSSFQSIPILPNNFLSDFPNLEVLNLSQNQLEELPNLSTLHNLTDLNLRGNKIKFLNSSTFSNNKDLKKIALSNNHLQSIEPFSFPESVEYLEISGQRLTTLTNKSFANLINLKYLMLENAPLTNIEPECFNNLPQLTVVWLNRAQFKKFPTLKNLPQLTNLSMNGVKLEEEPLVLQNLPSLTLFQSMQSNLIYLPKFSNVPNLTTVELMRNKIQNLTVDFFIQIPSLISIDVTGNRIKELGEIRSPRLEKLLLGKNDITNLTKIAFQHLDKLKELDMAKNKINEVNFYAFDNLIQLRRLDLSLNNISFSESPYKDFKNEDGLGGFSSYSPLHRCVNLQRLNLSHNQIDVVFDDWKTVLTRVENLDLSYNKFTSANILHDLHFISSQNLQLNLSNNQISTINMNGYYLLQQQESTVTEVHLDGNPFSCDCQAYLVKTSSLKSLRFHTENLRCAGPIHLSNSKLSEVNDKDFQCQLSFEHGCPTETCSCFQRPSDSTIVVNCSNRNLNSLDLPQSDWDFKQFNPWGKDFDFSGNNLTEISEAYISRLPPKTNFIDLSRNHLKSVGFLNTLNNNLQMNFSFANNPFPCDSCSDFVVVWATQTSRILDSDNITCVNGDNTADRLTLQNISNLVEDCSNRINTTGIHILIISVAVFATLCLVLIVFILKYSWVIKAFLFSKGWGWCLFWDNNADDDDQERIYDAFVSYSHKDEDWVIDELVNRLEEKEGFKLCLHFRDWTAGDWIPDQIVKSVDQSKRTVVILSKNFVDSVWSRLEFKAAHAQALSQRSNRVILVLIEDDLKEQDVHDDDLRVYMKMNTYLKWNDPWFWHKLKYALPHRKTHEEENANIIKKMQQREKARELDKLRTKLEQVI